MNTDFNQDLTFFDFSNLDFYIPEMQNCFSFQDNHFENEIKETFDNLLKQPSNSTDDESRSVSTCKLFNEAIDYNILVEEILSIKPIEERILEY